MNRAGLQVGIAVALVIVVACLPVKQRCGAAGYTCATAPDAQGEVHYYYEVEPLGVQMIESATHSNIPLFYRSGEDVEKAR